MSNETKSSRSKRGRQNSVRNCTASTLGIKEIFQAFGSLYCGISVSYTTDCGNICYDISHTDLMTLISECCRHTIELEHTSDTSYESILTSESERIKKISNETNTQEISYNDYPKLVVHTDLKQLADWIKTSNYLRSFQKTTRAKTYISWVEINGRLLSMVNKKKNRGRDTCQYQYYISDHGEILDIQWQQYDILFSNRYSDECVQKISNSLRADGDVSDIVTAFIKFNHLETPEEFIRHYYRTLNDPKISNDITKFNSICKWVNRKIERLNNDGNKKKEVEDTFRYASKNIEIINATKKDKIKKLVDLVEIMQNWSGENIEECLYRPLSAFWGKHGAPYYVFHNEIEKYIIENEPNTPEETSKDLVKKMRSILKNRQDGNIPSFLPNLVGAWFLSETARRHESYIFSLLIMDMIENSWSYTMDPNEYSYTWKNILVHPTNDDIVQNNTIAYDDTDLERTKKQDNIFFAYVLGGRHPMASKGTANTTGVNAFETNLIKPKEYSLLVHWVYKCLKHFIKDTSVTITLKSVEDDSWGICNWKLSTTTVGKTSFTSGSRSVLSTTDMTTSNQSDSTLHKNSFIEKIIMPLLNWRCSRVIGIEALRPSSDGCFLKACNNISTLTNPSTNQSASSQVKCNLISPVHK